MARKRNNEIPFKEDSSSYPIGEFLYQSFTTSSDSIRNSPIKMVGILMGIAAVVNLCVVSRFDAQAFLALVTDLPFTTWVVSAMWIAMPVVGCILLYRAIVSSGEYFIRDQNYLQGYTIGYEPNALERSSIVSGTNSNVISNSYRKGQIVRWIELLAPLLLVVISFRFVNLPVFLSWVEGCFFLFLLALVIYCVRWYLVSPESAMSTNIMLTTEEPNTKSISWRSIHILKMQVMDPTRYRYWLRFVALLFSMLGLVSPYISITNRYWLPEEEMWIGESAGNCTFRGIVLSETAAYVKVLAETHVQIFDSHEPSSDPGAPPLHSVEVIEVGKPVIKYIPVGNIHDRLIGSRSKTPVGFHCDYRNHLMRTGNKTNPHYP